jgi:sialic acid synthase SpsE
MIVSTGMADLAEVGTAVDAMESGGNRDYILLHCVSNYPAEAADVNLRAMHTLETAFGNPVGYSDHTLGAEVALAAVAMGACVIEKHLTLDRTLPGPDHRASAEPDELAVLVRGIRKVEAAMGDGSKRPALSETETATVARKSLVAARDLTAGTVLSEVMLTAKRPGSGLSPAMQAQILGRVLLVDVPADTILALDMLE